MSENVLLLVIGFIHTFSWLLIEYCVNSHHMRVKLKDLIKVGLVLGSAYLFFAVMLRLPMTLSIALLIFIQALMDYLLFKNNKAFSIVLTSIFFVMTVNLNLIILTSTEYFTNNHTAVHTAEIILVISVVVYSLVLIIMRGLSRWISDLNNALSARSKISTTLITLNGLFPMLLYGLFLTIRGEINPVQTLGTEVYKVWIMIEVMFFLMILLYFFISFLLIYFYIKYKKKSEYDAMTDTLNKTTGMLKLKKMIQKASQYKKPLSVCFIDIDALKAINDHYGHDKGDMVILKLVEAIKKNIRESDAFFRFGGDEFVIGIYNCDHDIVEQIFQRVLNELRHCSEVEDHPFDMCFSYGIKVFDSEDEMDAEELIVLADQEMYKKKFMNKVIAYNV